MKEIGRLLAARRKELGLDVADAQSETKIRRKYIEALEAGDPSVIPGEVYVKGFLRSYANFLGLEGDELVRRYREWRAGTGEAGPDRTAPGGTALGGTGAGRAPAGAPAGGRAATDGRPGAPGAGAARGTGRPGAARAGEAGAAGRSADRVVGEWLEPGRARRPAWPGAVAAYLAIMVLLVGLAGLWYAWTHELGLTRGAAGDEPPGQAGEPAPPGSGQPGSGEEPGQPTPPEEEPPGEEPAARWAVVAESDAELRYVVYGTPFTVRIEIIDRCWIKAEVDGRVVLEATLLGGATQEWTTEGSARIRFGRPSCARLWLDGELLGPAGADRSARTVFFEVGAPPGEGPSGPSGGTGEG